MRILFLIFILAAGCQRSAQVPDPAPKETIGAGENTMASYDFKSFEPYLDRGNDSIYVINFWATWCAPCVKEIPHFKAMSDKFKNDKVRVLLVSLDMKREVEGTLIPFTRKHGIEDQVIHLHEPDADAWIPKVDSTWSGALPATLIYSQKKRKFYERSFTQSELESEINSFLN